MAKIQIHAGDLDHGAWQFSSLLGVAIMTRASTASHLFKGETYNFGTDFERVELLSEEQVKKLAGTAGWGLAGAVLLGPIGAIGGMLLGGNKKEVVIACYLKDGRKFMATTDSKTWTKISASMF
ncbi:hypothetical protein [Pseudidiomarina donghaiensis]|uniref:Uncharacterized protein n=1 Tax=Pseudidiomarina donghaiensis TaxID=519452 RepID=A0A432XK22_9GAMM|nr:hypothetical protein [Pseudidiomarina donghaiensis]RUO48972.1 hypothetical protein CWE24_00180 [Pseudidiomarina donghaiensis]SFV20347.1 hypothetical protein SAMN04488139_0169 [Pseudidiomarina donghaiensis]